MKAPFSPKKSIGETRKHARLPMKPLHKISLQLAKNGMFFKIANISVGGVGFFAENDGAAADKAIGNKPFSVKLHIDKHHFEVDIEIVHTEKGITGCRFKNPEVPLRAAIEEYFVTELAALKVNMVETRDEEGTSGKTLFFRGQNNCELLVQEIDGVLQRFNVILFGNYLEGDGKGSLSVGEKIESSTVTPPQGVHLFKPLSKPDAGDVHHLVESAIRFIDGVEGLSDLRKEHLIAALDGSRAPNKNLLKVK